MIIVRNKMTRLILPGRFHALCIWPFLLIRPDMPMELHEIMNHELIHVRQQLEMAWILFFIWYLLEFSIRFLFLRNFKKAYQSLSHEKEAYINDADPDYLKKRKPYAWIKYL